MALPVNTYSFQVRIGMASGITADASTNTWHFRWDAAGSPDITDFTLGPRAMLNTFYNSIGGLLSNDVQANDLDLKAYEAWQPVPRVPVFTSTLGTITKGGTVAVPELAMVLSFQAATAIGVSQARRRNRVYIGPLGFVSTGKLLPAPQQTTLKDAGAALLAASNADADWTWVVASPTSNSTAPVANGWVDNAWDIQRRRGVDPTSRITF